MKKLIIAGIILASLFAVNSNCFAENLVIEPPTAEWKIPALIGSGLIVVAGVLTLANTDTTIANITSGITTICVGMVGINILVINW